MPLAQRTAPGAISLPRPAPRRRPPQQGPVPFAAVAPEPPSAPAVAPVPSHLERLGLKTASVVHDFNNLLSVIMVCAGEIADSASGSVQRERAHEISAAATRGAELTRRLLDGERPERSGIEPVAVDIAIIDALPLLRRTLPSSTDLNLASEGHLPHVLLARGELERMLVNLAANSRDAITASDAGTGTVAIRAAVSSVPPGDPILPVGWCVRISFCDDGVGMAPEAVSRALHPYYSTKNGGGGTGLGLPTVLALARASGGDVRISSAPGAGTAVSIYLPAVRAGGEPLTLQRVQASPAFPPQAERAFLRSRKNPRSNSPA